MTPCALTPAEVERLATIVDRHCTLHGIRSIEARESVAASALAHYERGIKSDDELLTALAEEDDPSRSFMSKRPGGSSGYSP